MTILVIYDFSDQSITNHNLLYLLLNFHDTLNLNSKFNHMKIEHIEFNEFFLYLYDVKILKEILSRFF